MPRYWKYDPTKHENRPIPPLHLKNGRTWTFTTSTGPGMGAGWVDQDGNIHPNTGTTDPDNSYPFGVEVPTKEDPISPSHYQFGGAQTIDIIEHLPYNRGAACKYLVRAGRKGAPDKELEDLKKARWYVEREISRLEKEAE